MKDGQTGYRIISLVRNAVSQDRFKKEVLSCLCDELNSRMASIVIRSGDTLTSWTLRIAPDSSFRYSKKTGSSESVSALKDWSISEGITIPFEINGTMEGKLCFVPEQGFENDASDQAELSNIAGILGQAIAFRMSQAALRERVKEITCLYEITNIMHRASGDLEQTLLGVVAVIPRAFQYPDHARACISLHGKKYGCLVDAEDSNTLESDIVLSDKRQGSLMVRYENIDDVPQDRSFLREEQDLLDGIANQLSFLIEERELEEDRRRLEVQLRHADRLATLGQLTAGVAHDINEPLANVLGFAELLRKTEGLPEQAGKDIEKIIRSSIYARDIVRKLLAFTGKISEDKSVLELNEVILKGVQFFEARCRNQNIEITTELSKTPLWVKANPSEVNQVLVNLLVNSIQALPDGGRIEISSRRDHEDIIFDIWDNGAGIDPEQQENIFLPFFTTKERGKGTGLGLSTVLGIINSYKGSIEVESELDAYTRFAVKLPGIAGHDE